MTLSNAIRQALNDNPHQPAEELAQTLLDNLSNSDLLHLVTEEVRDHQRARTRTIEWDAFTTRKPTGQTGRGQELLHQADPFATLRGEVFRLGDGTQVEWTKATAEQHKQRVAMLERIRDGINHTIDRHQEAIQEIEKAGVTCLEELTASKPKSRKRKREAVAAAG